MIKGKVWSVVMSLSSYSFLSLPSIKMSFNVPYHPERPSFAYSSLKMLQYTGISKRKLVVTKHGFYFYKIVSSCPECKKHAVLLREPLKQTPLLN